tara:strand:- start:298 stop:522 length:225 start_codon:yes stop_codon:yes gene_type:complete
MMPICIFQKNSSTLARKSLGLKALLDMRIQRLFNKVSRAKAILQHQQERRLQWQLMSWLLKKAISMMDHKGLLH